MSGAVVALKAAPRGNRCGLVAVGTAERQLLVAVLPKHWRGSGPRVFTVPAPAARSSVAVLHEGDVLVLPAALTDLALEAVAGRERELLALTTVSDAPRALAPTDLRQVSSLFGLEALVDPGARRADLSLAADPHASAAFGWARLVALAEPLARHVRQGYVEHEERLSALRGRVVAADVVQARAEGRTAVLCRFDDLTPGTALQRVVVTALDVCARPADGLDAVLAQALGEVPSRAVRLRRRLREVPSLPVAEAVRVGRGLRLGRLEGTWRPVLRAALQVLSGTHVGPAEAQPDDIRLREVVVRTERLWEGLLERAVRRRWPGAEVLRSDQDGLHGAAAVQAPWTGAGRGGEQESYPDLVVLHDGAVWCGDAKYKRLSVSSSDGRTAVSPDRSDLYQMFAYSHLTRRLPDAAAVTRCALLYPAEHDQPQGLLATLVRVPEPLDLDVMTLPWPGPDDVQLGLDAYLRLLADALPSLTGSTAP